MKALKSLSFRSLFLERDAILVASSLIALCVLSWLYLVHLAAQMEAMDGIAGRMMGMPASDGISDLLAAALSPAAASYADVSINFLLVTLMWAVMMMGMMLPSASPTILLFSALERKRSASNVYGRTPAFVAGYLIVWSLFSVGAALVQTALARSGLLSMEMATVGTFLGGVLFVAAGAYELTPLKGRCLTHCQSPLTWIPHHMRPGRAGAVRMGIDHGIYCVGCCWALMILLFVGGVMNLAWVAAITTLVFAQKLLPKGRLSSRISGTVLLVCGVGLILWGFPSSS